MQLRVPAASMNARPVTDEVSVLTSAGWSGFITATVTQRVRAYTLASGRVLRVATRRARTFALPIRRDRVTNYVGKAQRPAPKRANFIPSTPNYYAYSWIDKDPDMDLIIGILGESGLSPEDVEHETEKLGHKVSRYTIMGWLYGSVRRPQNYTMTIVAMACGWTKTWHPNDQRDQSKRPATAPQSEKVRNVAHH
jgi:hypothetical protein